MIPVESIDQRECQFCGAHVSRDFRRTFGDSDNIAHRCPACDSMTRLSSGTAAGRDVATPDPADQPNRNRGSRTDARTDGGTQVGRDWR